MIDQSILQQHVQPVRDKTRFLDSSHLRDDIKTIVVPFETLAEGLLGIVPSSPELTIAVQKLVEAKDQAVRAYLYALENKLTHIAPGVYHGEPASSNSADAATAFKGDHGDKF